MPLTLAWLTQELADWVELEHLRLLNLTYDAMPASYVSMIVTELGCTPPTSVPVILREYIKQERSLNSGL
eukprot:scaffold1511_cov347-Prasinococcus_capsulatus_cf.AAC.5